MTATDQPKLEPARAHHETRAWIREMLAQRGPMATGEIAHAIGAPMKLTARKLDDMESARMVKIVGTDKRRQNLWALRCWKPAEKKQILTNETKPTP